LLRGDKLKAPGDFSVHTAGHFRGLQAADRAKFWMPIIQEILQHQAEIEIFYGLPPQAQIEPKVGWDSEVGYRIDVIQRAIEFQFPGSVKPGSEVKLIIGIVTNKTYVSSPFNIQPGISADQFPIVRDIPGGGDLYSDCFRMLSVLKALCEN
jgi:hypothetical protein